MADEKRMETVVLALIDYRCMCTPFLEESPKSGVVPVTEKKLSPGGKVNSKVIEQFL